MSRRKHNQRSKLHIKRGDEVQVISGRERGKSGRVLRIIHKSDGRTGATQVRDGTGKKRKRESLGGVVDKVLRDIFGSGGNGRPPKTVDR